MKMVGLKELAVLAKLRNSEVLVYFTSDKNSGNPKLNLAASIADDVVPLFNEQLRIIGKTKKITLFLYSAGGFLTTPWPLVNLIREYCDEFEVIVPFRALSAATLITLGADKIVMTPLSQLGPIDPTGQFLLGDKNLQVQVEDITSFIDFAKKKNGLKSQDALSVVFQEITKHIPPSVIGSINRTHSLIRMLAEKMLDLHKQKLAPKTKKQIVQYLTEKLFSHQHYINRKEAINLGMVSLIEKADQKNEEAINALFEVYSSASQILNEFQPVHILGEKETESFELLRAAVHSTKLQFTLTSKYQVQKIANPSGGQMINVAPTESGWQKLKNEDATKKSASHK